MAFVWPAWNLAVGQPVAFAWSMHVPSSAVIAPDSPMLDTINEDGLGGQHWSIEVQ